MPGPEPETKSYTLKQIKTKLRILKIGKEYLPNYIYIEKSNILCINSQYMNNNMITLPIKRIFGFHLEVVPAITKYYS